jgi:hypothetical protein
MQTLTAWNTSLVSIAENRPVDAHAHAHTQELASQGDTDCRQRGQAGAFSGLFPAFMERVSISKESFAS